jgi:hypothetical protein
MRLMASRRSRYAKKHCDPFLGRLVEGGATPLPLPWSTYASMVLRVPSRIPRQVFTRTTRPWIATSRFGSIGQFPAASWSC